MIRSCAGSALKRASSTSRSVPFVNAVWDLWAKTLGKPVWQIVAEMTPEEFVRCIDFRYITDALTPEEAIALLKESEKGKAERFQEALQSRAVPAYTTSAGWLGYGEDKMKALLNETLSQGYRHFKLKVGGSVEEDRRRLSIARDVIGFDRGNILMVDANQVWSVPEAIEYMKQLADFKPWFIEEPTSPDDILGHKAVRDALRPLGIGVATGEMCQNPRRVQAAADGRRHRRVPDRRVSTRRGETRFWRCCSWPRNSGFPSCHTRAVLACPSTRNI